jgi:predicted phosphodiesterase
MKLKIKFLTLFFMAVMTNNLNTNAQLRLGVFADCQYCDCEPMGSRFYRSSPEKLRESIGQFNREKNLAFAVGLGDLIDRNFSSFDTLQPILEQSVHKIYNIPGNHDFEVEKEKLKKVQEALGLAKTYYTIEKDDWHLVFLNGNEITFNSLNPEIVDEAEKILAELKAAEKPNSYEWNGGMSRQQISWLDQQLEAAQNKNQKAAIFCHYPLLPFEAHALWNAEEVLKVLKKYNHVKLWLNGHNHKGNYTKQHGIHFLTVKAIVETENENAFSIFTFSEDKIEIEGFGREPDRELVIE